MDATCKTESENAGRIGSLRKAEVALMVSVIVSVFLAILRCAPLIASPYQIDYGEGLMLDGALRLRHHQPLYPNPHTFPIVLHVYGPVAYAAAASILPNGTASFPSGRVLILICSVLLASLLSRILWRLTGSWRIGVSFGFMLMALPAFRFWIYLLRADVMGVLFSMMGITLYLFGKRQWYWSIPFFGLSLFCKYSLVAAPIAVFLHLILRRRVRQAGFFGAGLGAATVFAFIVAQYRTGGWFAFHMFSTHPDRYSLGQFFALGALVWLSAPVVTALAVWYLVVDYRAGGHSFPTIYLLASTVTALTAGKLGSTTNHFIEWMAACCLCAGMGYSFLLSNHAARALPVTVLLSASLLAGIVGEDRLQLQRSRDLVECGSAYRYLSNSSSSHVLSDSLGPPLGAGKPIMISDSFVYSQLVQHGLWPDREVVDLVNQKYFGLIVMSADPSLMTARGATWPESLGSAIDRNYRVVARFTCRDASEMLEPVPSKPDR